MQQAQQAQHVLAVNPALAASSDAEYSAYYARQYRIKSEIAYPCQLIDCGAEIDASGNGWTALAQQNWVAHLQSLAAGFKRKIMSPPTGRSPPTM